MCLVIIDRNRPQCSECDIRSSFTQFHPTGLLRNPASFERFCGSWLTGGNTCGAPSLCVCVCVSPLPLSLSLSPSAFLKPTDWLTGYLTDRISVVEPCSPGIGPGHIWPQYTSPRVSAPHLSQSSRLKQRKPECDRNNCVCMEDILSQSNVAVPSTWSREHTNTRRQSTVSCGF